MDIVNTHKTLTSFFYDLVKAVPAGTINAAIMNTILVEENEDLRKYAESCSRQLLEYRTKYTLKQRNMMGYPDTVTGDDK